MARKINYKLSSAHDDFVDLKVGDYGIIECDSDRIFSKPNSLDFDIKHPIASVKKQLLKFGLGHGSKWRIIANLLYNQGSDFAKTADTIIIYQNCFIEIRNFDPPSSSAEQDFDIIDFDVSMENPEHKLLYFLQNNDCFVFVIKGAVNSDNLVSGILLKDFTASLEFSKINLKNGRSGYVDLTKAEITEEDILSISKKIKQYIELGFNQ